MSDLFQAALSAARPDDDIILAIYDWHIVKEIGVSREYRLTVAEMRALLNAPPAPPAGPVAYTVTENGLRVRTAPGLNAVVVGWLNKGALVMIDRTETAGNHTWGHIADGQYRDRWVAMEYLKR